MTVIFLFGPTLMLAQAFPPRQIYMDDDILPPSTENQYAYYLSMAQESRTSSGSPDTSATQEHPQDEPFPD